MGEDLDFLGVPVPVPGAEGLGPVLRAGSVMFMAPVVPAGVIVWVSPAIAWDKRGGVSWSLDGTWILSSICGNQSWDLCSSGIL